MLNIGIIGYGSRVAGMAQSLSVFGIPHRIAAIADPRAREIRMRCDPLLEETKFFATADDLIREGSNLEGIMIGTRCRLHTEMACKVADLNLPLFLEKPVAISFAQLKQLEKRFSTVKTPTVVSFPLRLSPILQRVKAIIDSGQIGTVENVVAWCNVPYATVYYTSWHRNYEENGGLFLQKATHDLDYINYLLADTPKWISAMKALRVFGGDMPFDLQCKDCLKQESCPESPFNRFRFGYEGEMVRYRDDDQFCLFAEGFQHEDTGSCLIEYGRGCQVSYTQNFFTRYQAAQRGARLYGYLGTVEFDWYRNQIRVFSHTSPTVETIEFGGNMPHFGGDRELCYDFLVAMRDGRSSRSPLAAGILSARTCLWARYAAETRQVCAFEMEEPVKA